MPTIAPPLTQRDVQVVAAVETQLTAAQTDLLQAAQSFSVSPQKFAQALQAAANLAGGAPSIGAGVVAPTLVGEPTTSLEDIINDFLDGGLTQVIGNLLLAASLAIFDDGVVPGEGEVASLPSTLVDGFFFGYPSGDDPNGVLAVVNILFDFLTSGIQPTPIPEAAASIGAGVVAPTLVGEPTTSLEDIINDFLDGGVTQVVGNLLLAASLAIFDDGVVPGEGEVASLPSTLVDGFFFGYPSGDDPNGVLAVVNILFDALTSGIQPTPIPEAAALVGAGVVAPTLVGEPTTSLEDIINDFLDGGVTQVVGNLLLAASLAIFDDGVVPGEGEVASLPSTLVDGFFFGYPSGDGLMGSWQWSISCSTP